jgi:hypothetical protein
MWLAIRCLLLTVLMSAASCELSAQSDPVGRFAGTAYMGRLEARTVVPNGARSSKTQSGNGSAQFLQSGAGRTRLVVSGQINKPGDAGFAIEGARSGNVWRSKTGDDVLLVDEQGRISGGGIAAPHRMTFNGQVTGQRFDLLVDLELLEATRNGLPVGTKVALRYDLHSIPADEEARPRTARRTDTSKPAAEANTNREERPCKRTIWQARNVADFSGGMQMVQVPVCVNW